MISDGWWRRMQKELDQQQRTSSNCRSAEHKLKMFKQQLLNLRTYGTSTVVGSFRQAASVVLFAC